MLHAKGIGACSTCNAIAPQKHIIRYAQIDVLSFMQHPLYLQCLNLVAFNQSFFQISLGACLKLLSDCIAIRNMEAVALIISNLVFSKFLIIFHNFQRFFLIFLLLENAKLH